MALVKTTLSLTTQDRQWIDGMIENGEFVSSSEYVRSLIRKDKNQRCQIDAIRAKLIKAEQGGFVNQAADEILQDIKNEARSNGNL